MLERLYKMYEEKKWEPQSFIRIHPEELSKGSDIAVLVGGIIGGAISFQLALGQVLSNRILFASLGAGAFVFYVKLRMKNDRRGWYLYEHEGKIIWYTGWGSEKKLEIKEIAAIDFTGLATLKNHRKVKMPDPDETWYPFYLHLYKSYPALFETRPVLYNPRRTV